MDEAADDRSTPVRDRAAPPRELEHEGRTGRTGVLIVGGGLSGLALAERLEAAGIDWHLVEARPRAGGRILTDRTTEVALDLGPAWIWPGQPRVAVLAQRMGIDIFDQHQRGRLVHAGPDGQVRRDLDIAPMAGARRIAGGIGRLTDGLAARLPAERMSLGAAVTALALGAHGIRAILATDGPARQMGADRVVLALPPRLAAATIAFRPGLPVPLVAAMRRTPTWMAGHAKLFAIYDRPFWRAAGLSGSGFAQNGPLAEIHDASPAGDGPGALFGFVALPAAARAADPDGLRRSAVARLATLFGPEAAMPQAVIVQDWAREPWTATPDDLAPVAGHPDYRPLAIPSGAWSDRLILAGTEVAPGDGGLVEGALAAAEAAASALARPAIRPAV